ncbi:hypothetical protein UFOVP2_30 [uncultured Caudovirales phage]|uniref:Uncharacterized protein n=1 Tax=uncultured Caudovirales phage TaxID=2100421 RepID=A0A6J5KI73_9CAUD|nr:hypothetical protein UFOVP2_30 [uncultured Caudovirales phage]
MDIETEAKALGWIPKDQFRGDESKWTDADEFVRRGKDIMPILRKNNEKLLTEVTDVKGQLGAVQTALREAQESMAEFKKYHEETAQRAYDAALRDLRAQKATAITENDGATVVAVEEAIDKLNKQAPVALKSPEPSAPTTPPQVHPDFAKWESDNSPWLSDADKKAYAHSIGGYVRAMNPNLTGRAFLDKITEEVEKRFGGSAPTQKVEAGGTPSRKSGRTFTDLPAEAKAACDRFGAKMVGANRAFKTMAEWRASYVSSYDWN